jgi:hypothetical protein
VHGHSEDIGITNELKTMNVLDICRLAGSVSTSNLAKKGNHTFIETSGQRIMDVNMADRAKEFPTPKQAKQSNSDKPAGKSLYNSGMARFSRSISSQEFLPCGWLLDSRQVLRYFNWFTVQWKVFQSRHDSQRS